MSARSYFIFLGIAVLIAGALVVLRTAPYHAGPHRAEANMIVNNLRHLEAAKEEWAHEHGVTNSATVESKDLTKYLPFRRWITPVAGELYRLNAIDARAEAELTRAVGDWPSGAIVRLNPTNMQHEVMLPNQHLQATPR